MHQQGSKIGDRQQSKHKQHKMNGSIQTMNGSIQTIEIIVNGDNRQQTKQINPNNTPIIDEQMVGKTNPIIVKIIKHMQGEKIIQLISEIKHPSKNNNNKIRRTVAIIGNKNITRHINATIAGANNKVMARANQGTHMYPNP
jgi:hypothetical protein